MKTEKATAIDFLLSEKRFIEAQQEILDMNEVDIAEMLGDFDLTSTLISFRMLPKSLAANVFANLPNDRQSLLIDSITDTELSPLLDELFVDDLVDIIEEMPANVVKRILKNTPIKERTIINQLLHYPEDSAGRLTTIEYVHLRKDMTVGEALVHIRETGLEKETIYTCYVTDQNRLLEGIVSLRRLVLANTEQKIEEIYEDDFIYVSTLDDQESVAHIFQKYGFLALPVADREKRLVGIITVDDIMRIMEEETTEDFQKMAAMQPTDQEYLDIGILDSARHRLGWLIFLMVSGGFTAALIHHYDQLLTTIVALTAFIPMLMNTGGNSGSQSSTLIIRGLATNEISLSDWRSIVWKELRIGLLVGTVLGSLAGLKLFFFEAQEWQIATTVGITLLATVCMAKLVGSSLPLLAKRLNLDPAIMAGPLISTVVDLVSLAVYFGIASFALL